MNKIKIFFSKLKAIKHIEIYIAIAAAVLICGVYFLTNGFSSKKSLSPSTNVDTIESNFSTSAEYVDYLENKLESVITNVKGVSDANVIITLEKGFEYKYVTEEETSTTTNGTVVSKSTVVMIDGKPVLQDEIYPLIKGIVVVAKGVGDVQVKMNVISLIQTVIDVENSKINILESK